MSEDGRDEPFDESSARILCGVNPALRNSEAFDELSARIFVPEYSRTMNPAEPVRTAPCNVTLIDVRARLAVPFVAGVASTREASRCVGANGIGVTVNRADDALIDVRARLAVPFVAGVASTREASNCVGAVCINGTVIRPHGALIDVRARHAVPLVAGIATASVCLDIEGCF